MLALLSSCSMPFGGPEGAPPGQGDCDELVVGWLDEDGDGFGREQEEACEAQWYWVDAGGDCNDEDPLIHPDALEICEPWSRGVDEDCDGTLDCEDADCRDECLEDDCNDGYDQDDDGLTDCEDDDCLGTADCASFTAYITGGGAYTLSRYAVSQQLWATSVKGHVIFTEGIVGSCTFTLGRVEIWTSYGITTDVRREDIWPSDGCPSSLSTGFLPRTSELTFSGSRMPRLNTGAPWYGSTLTSSSWGSSSTFYRGAITGGSTFSR